MSTDDMSKSINGSEQFIIEDISGILNTGGHSTYGTQTYLDKDMSLSIYDYGNFRENTSFISSLNLVDPEEYANFRKLKHLKNIDYSAFDDSNKRLEARIFNTEYIKSLESYFSDDARVTHKDALELEYNLESFLKLSKKESLSETEYKTLLSNMEFLLRNEFYMGVLNKMFVASNYSNREEAGEETDSISEFKKQLGESVLEIASKLSKNPETGERYRRLYNLFAGKIKALSGNDIPPHESDINFVETKNSSPFSTPIIFKVILRIMEYKNFPNKKILEKVMKRIDFSNLSVGYSFSLTSQEAEYFRTPEFLRALSFESETDSKTFATLIKAMFLQESESDGIDFMSDNIDPSLNSRAIMEKFNLNCLFDLIDKGLFVKEFQKFVGIDLDKEPLSQKLNTIDLRAVILFIKTKYKEEIWSQDRDVAMNLLKGISEASSLGAENYDEDGLILFDKLDLLIGERANNISLEKLELVPGIERFNKGIRTSGFARLESSGVYEDVDQNKLSMPHSEFLNNNIQLPKQIEGDGEKNHILYNGVQYVNPSHLRNNIEITSRMLTVKEAEALLRSYSDVETLNSVPNDIVGHDSSSNPPISYFINDIDSGRLDVVPNFSILAYQEGNLYFVSKHDSKIFIDLEGTDYYFPVIIKESSIGSTQMASTVLNIIS